MSQGRAQTPGNEFYLTIEDYYGIKMIDGSKTGGLDSQQDKKISFQQFIETRASENIFDNDVSLLRC